MNPTDPLVNARPHSASLADALSKAVEHSQRSLFPINGSRWVALAFIVFVARLGEGAAPTPLQLWGYFPRSGGGLGGGSGGFATEFTTEFSAALAYLHTHLALVLGVGALLLTLTCGFAMLLLWWSSRAQLMFVESLVWGNVEFSPQWARSATLGRSLWWLRVKLMLAGVAMWVSALGLALALGKSDFEAGTFWGPAAIRGYLALGGILCSVGVPLAVLSAILDDFVVPLMVVRNLRAHDGFRACSREVLKGNALALCIFYFVKFVVAGTAAFLLQVLACLTCCLSNLPYLGTLVGLPIHVFSGAFSLYYLEELGIGIFPRPDPAWLAEQRWRFPG